MNLKIKKLQTTHYKLLTQQGFSLIEMILASAVFSLIVTVLVGAYLYGQESTTLAGNHGRATLLAEEGLEAVKNIRDQNFSNLIDGTYGLATSSNQWVLSGSFDTTDIFTRQIIISSVDSKRKQITSNITWQQNQQRSGLISLITRLTNWMTSGMSDWSNPLQESLLNLSGNDNGVKVQISGNYAYVVRNSGTDFAIINISNPSSPSLTSSLSLAGSPSNIFISGNYAYVTSDDNSAELIIIDISNPSSPSIIGTYNDAGNEDARGVFVTNSFAYLALNGGNDLVIVNIANPSAPVFVGGITLSGSAFEVSVSGNYAYVASSSDNQELQIVNITTPTSPTLDGTLNLSGATNATTIATINLMAFLGQGNTFRAVNITTPNSPALLGSLQTSDTINDIALNFANNNIYAFIATNNNSAEFQVINISIPTSPVLLGSVNTLGSDDLNGVAYHQTLDRAVGVGDRDTAEVFIFAPQ